MTKTLNHIIYFFFLHQNQNIFFSNIGNQNIFLEKNHNPPPPPPPPLFKLNGRSLIAINLSIIQVSLPPPPFTQFNFCTCLSQSQSLFCLDISPLIYLFVSSSSISPKFPLFNHRYIY